MPRKKLRPDNQSINWVYHCKIVGDPPAVVFETERKMRRLWNELVAIHERTLYRLLRSIEQMFRGLSKQAEEEAGREREKGLNEQAETRDLDAEALRKRADEIKETAKTVMQQSYQGFDASKFIGPISESKQLKEEAKAAKGQGDLDRAGDLSDKAEALRAQGLAPAELRMTLHRLINAAHEAAARLDSQAEAEAREQIDELCADERLWGLANILFEERINYHVQERGRDLQIPLWCKWSVGDQFKKAMKAYASG